MAMAFSVAKMSEPKHPRPKCPRPKCPTFVYNIGYLRTDNRKDDKSCDWHFKGLSIIILTNVSIMVRCVPPIMTVL